MRRLVVLFLLSAAAAAQDPVEGASKGLLEDDPEARLAAAGRLARLGPAAAPAVPLLLDAAYDEEDMVARAAVDALGRIGPGARGATRGLRLLMASRPFLEPVVERALRGMGKGPGEGEGPDDPWPTAEQAFRTGSTGPTSVETAKTLAPLLDHPRAPVRMEAAWALAVNPAADPVFAAMLEDPQVRRRRIAAQHCFGTDSLPALLKALKDTDTRVRRGVLGSIRQPEALPDLLRLLDGGDPVLAEELSFALAGLGPAAAPAVPALMKQLESAQAENRRAACYALGQLGREAAGAVPPLIQACFDEEPGVSSSAIQALRVLGPIARDAAAYLAELADADHDTLARQAIEAIGADAALPPPPDPPDFDSLRRALGDADARTAGRAAFDLGRLGAKDPATLDTLAAALANPVPYARKQAMYALARIGPPGLPAVARVAREGRGPAQRLATHVLPLLAASAPEAVLPIALGLIDADDPYVRHEAIRAIGIIGPPAHDAAGRLLEGLRSSDGDLVRIAAWALGRVGAEAAVPALVDLIERPRGDDQGAVESAIFALAGIGAAAEVALPAIVAEARRPDDTHFSEALGALARMGPRGQGEVVALIRDEVGLKRAGAIGLLSAMSLDPPGFKEALDEAMKDPDTNVRQAALVAAQRLGAGARPGIATLVAVARAEPWESFQRSNLPHTLAEIASFGELLDLARDQDPRVRWAAWKALSIQAPESLTADQAAQALPLLLDALDHQAVRAAAIGCIGLVPLAPDARLLRIIATDRPFGPQIAKALRACGPGVVPALVTALGDEDWDVRAGAALVLGGFGTDARAAIPALRTAAIEAAAMLSDRRRAVPSERRRLSPQPFVEAIVSVADLATVASCFADARMPLRQDFGAKLLAAGDDGIPFLDRLRREDDRDVRRAAVGLFPRLGNAPLAWILDAAADPDADVARAGLAQLGPGVPAENAIPVLRAAAGDAARRTTALDTLRRRGADGFPVLEELAADPRPDVRAATLLAIGPVGAPVLGLLAEGLKAKEPAVRTAAATALSRLGPDGAPALPALRTLLADPEAQVRRAAAVTLGALKDTAAVPDLEKLFSTGDGADREAAGRALGLIGAPGATALARFLTHEDRTLRAAARESLIGAGAQAVPAVAAVMGADDAMATREAADVLARIGEPAVPALAELLRHKGAGVRRDAAWALGTMGNRALRAVPDLVTALDDRDTQVAPQAAWALGQIGPAARDALPALQRMYDTKRHRGIVADAIKRIRGT